MECLLAIIAETETRIAYILLNGKPGGLERGETVSGSMILD